MQYRALYTKHLTKKQKTWHDGFVVLRNKARIVLYDEAGKELSAAAMPASLALDSGERLSLFDGFLVDCDDPCTAEELPGGERGDATLKSSVDPVADALPSQQQAAWQQAAWRGTPKESVPRRGAIPVVRRGFHAPQSSRGIKPAPGAPAAPAVPRAMPAANPAQASTNVAQVAEHAPVPRQQLRSGEGSALCSVVADAP